MKIRRRGPVSGSVSRAGFGLRFKSGSGSGCVAGLEAGFEGASGFGFEDGLPQSRIGGPDQRLSGSAAWRNLGRVILGSVAGISFSPMCPKNGNLGRAFAAGGFAQKAARVRRAKGQVKKIHFPQPGAAREICPENGKFEDISCVYDACIRFWGYDLVLIFYGDFY